MKTKSIILAAFTLAICSAAEAGTRTRTATGPQGNTVSRSVWNPGYGVSRTVVRTGPAGNTAASTRVVTPAPYGRAILVTDPQGGQWSRSAYHGPFGHFHAREVTGPTGNTRRVIRIR